MAEKEPQEPGQQFVREWRVIAGNPRESLSEESYVIIEPGEKKGEFALFSRTGKDRKFHQVLRYMPDTKTLENRPDERERCIAFWPREERKADRRNNIFAHRIQEVGVPYGQPLLPWEEGDSEGVGNGSWGAEEGGG